MKSIKLVFVSSIMWFGLTTLNAQNTYVPDDNFEQALIDLGYDDTLDDYVLTANISGVTNLDVYDKSISDLTGIEAFTALTNLNCGVNQLTSLDVTANTALINLLCFNNQLTSLDVSKNTALTELSCEYNLLTSLDVSANTALTWLFCFNNFLTSLDVSSNTALTRLYCEYNLLTSLDVSSNTVLTELLCNDNRITSLDVSKNTVLSELQCFTNQLTSLDVSNNTVLQILNCGANQLTSLDVSKNTALVELVCSENQLTYLNMRNGITEQLIVFHENYNSNLTCIEVLDPAYATANWTSANGNIDAGVTFAVICGGTDLTTWHVATTGSDGSGSGTEMSPLATIQTGINATTEDDTVSVAAGTYVEIVNYNGKNISVIGADRETTIIDGNGTGTVVEIGSGLLKSFTIQNGWGGTFDGQGGGIEVVGSPTLDDLIIQNNQGGGSTVNAGGGVFTNNDTINIKNSTIKNNGGNGSWGGLYATGGVINAENCLINDHVGAETSFGTVNLNDCTIANGHIYIEGSLTVNNCTITNNNYPMGVSGGSLTINNSIYYNNGGGTNAIWYEGTPSITYSLIQGGWTGTGNIDADPFFVDAANDDYHLADWSPCIGAGTATNAHEPIPEGSNPDMGAYENPLADPAPGPFELFSPFKGETVEINRHNYTDTLFFTWTEAIDASGDDVTYDFEFTGDLGVLYWHFFDHCDETEFMCKVPNHRIEDFLSIEGVEVVSGTWSVIATDGKGYSYPTNGPFELTIDASSVSVDEPMLIPETFSLHANYPNPFNPSTAITYDLPKRSLVTLGIYDILGKQIKTLVNQSQDAGNKIAVWDGTDDLGRQVSAGVYLYQIQAGEFSQARKMLLLK